MKFEYKVQIREHHLDTFGHVNNAKYLEILEEARWELISNSGFSLMDIMTHKIGPIILSVNMQFKRELKNRENITVTSECTKYEGKIAEMVQVMKRESGEECCVATYTFALFDLKARKIIPPTPEWLKAVGRA